MKSRRGRPVGSLSKTKSRGTMTVDRKQNKQIKTLQKKVAKLVGADEKKWYDTNRPSTAISNSGNVQPLLGLNVWAGNNEQRQHEREGNSILMTSYKIQGEVYIDYSFASPDKNNKVRVILVQMLDDCYDAPVITDILDDISTGNALYSFYKIKGLRRFKIHYDKTFNLQNPDQGTTMTATEPWRKTFNISAKVPKAGLKVEYRQGSISGNGPVTNGLYLLTLSDSAAISHPAYVYRARMRFLDN